MKNDRLIHSSRPLVEQFRAEMSRWAVSLRYPPLRRIDSESPNSSIVSDGWPSANDLRSRTNELVRKPPRLRALSSFGV
jgi:hypothetical protein